MDMQDKEFDKIFNSKFEDFEVEPSPMIWDNIAGELDGKKTKVVLMPWLSIAATVLVVIGAGVFFLQKGEITKDQPKENKLVASHVETPATVTSAQSVEAVITKPTGNVASIVKRQNNTEQPVNNLVIPVNNTPEPTVKTEPVKPIDQPRLIAAVTAPASTNVSTTATVPDVKLAPQAADAAPQVEKPVMAAQPTALVKKRGIHSFGGLINALVAKVDKREDKLIEFSDGDEDDENATKLTGVNLGLIKIKQQ